VLGCIVQMVRLLIDCYLFVVVVVYMNINDSSVLLLINLSIIILLLLMQCMLRMQDHYNHHHQRKKLKFATFHDFLICKFLNKKTKTMDTTLISFLPCSLNMEN
jgi:hypothetical protein